jgi:hypothetical protein
VGRFSGEHLLDRLAGYAHLSGNLGLAKTLSDELANQLSPLRVELLCQQIVLDRLGTGLVQAAKRLFVGAAFRCRTPILSTTVVNVNPG